ncbi:GNAT family N-acetyltransferase [Altericista sp. CCNU0014]|uniref:GNAT family N-acetyltransferase n=1 Tax=Altericista sp. CCNU0014 TaxID=3082949 RepID=UPI00384F1C45
MFGTGISLERSHRTATLADLPRIVEIYNATVPSRQVTADLEPVTVESRIQWFHAHRPDTRPLWVVEANDEILAWLSFSDFYGRPGYNRTAELSVYVDASARRTGLGTYLLSEAIRCAPCLNLDRLLAFVFGHNEPSLALFQKFGFQQWGFLPGVGLLDNIDRDLVILGFKIET